MLWLKRTLLIKVKRIVIWITFKLQNLANVEKNLPDRHKG